jgi:RNase P subunit RPR2
MKKLKIQNHSELTVKGFQVMAGNKKILDIEKYSELQFSQEEVSIIMDNENLFKRKDEINAYKRGSLRAIAEVRKAIFKTAKQGSTPAQKQYMDLEKSKNDKNIIPILEKLSSITCPKCRNMVEKLIKNIKGK